MLTREFTQKIIALGITISLIALIFLVLAPPPSIAVHLETGTPIPLSGYTGTTITFQHVNLTIKGPEAIIVNYLNFSIFNANDQLVAHVKFFINGTEISPDYPAGKFTVVNETNTSDLPYVSSGIYYGYDEHNGQNYSFGYGYGYGSGTTPLTILYTIKYKTHTTGTFYAQLYVNSTTHTYASGESTTFTITTQSTPPSGGDGTENAPTANPGGPYTGVVGTPIQFSGSKSTALAERTIRSYSWAFGDGTTSVGVITTHTYLTAGTYTVRLTVTDNTGVTDSATTTATITSTAPPAATIRVSNQTMQTIANTFDVTLQQQFYASDTNGDGIVDGFTDPNNQLTPVSFVNINGHPSFLLSTNNDDLPEFFWDTTNNAMTPVNRTPASLTNPIIITADKTVHIQLTVNKSGWIYIDITDTYPIEEYPEYTLTIKAGDRTISPDRIWRKNGKIYILDDPALTYELIYGYTILPPIFHPVNSMTLSTARPTFTITYPHPVYMITAVLDATNILHLFTTTDNQVFTYTPNTDLNEGTHTISLTVQDDQGMHTLASTATYTVNLPKQQVLSTPWIIPIIIAIVLIVILCLVFLRNRAYI